MIFETKMINEKRTTDGTSTTRPIVTITEVNQIFKEGTENGLFPKASISKMQKVMAMSGWTLIKGSGNPKHYWTYDL